MEVWHPVSSSSMSQVLVHQRKITVSQPHPNLVADLIILVRLKKSRWQEEVGTREPAAPEKPVTAAQHLSLSSTIL
jgi:hypothetical protein